MWIRKALISLRSTPCIRTFNHSPVKLYCHSEGSRKAIDELLLQKNKGQISDQSFSDTLCNIIDEDLSKRGGASRVDSGRKAIVAATGARSVCFINNRRRGARKLVYSVDEPLTMDSLRLLIRRRFPEFNLNSFAVYGETSADLKGFVKLIESDKELTSHIIAGDFDPKVTLTFRVESLCKGFDKFTVKDALKYATGKSSPCSRQQDEKVEIDDTVFPQSDFDEHDPQISAILDHAVDDIIVKFSIFGPLATVPKESSVRELIGPILIAAVRVSNHITEGALIKIVSEKNITGSLGNGPVDYVIQYKRFNIVVATEAKKDDLSDGLGKNIAQLVAGREHYLFTTASTSTPAHDDNPSNKQYTDKLLAGVPSYGVVSSADKWVFTRYFDGDDEGEVLRSSSSRIPLENGGRAAAEADVRRDVLIVIRTLVGMLTSLKVEVDENLYIDNSKASGKSSKQTAVL